jgi:hypothetical protein
MGGDRCGGKGLLAGGIVALLSAMSTVAFAVLAADQLGYLIRGGREADATVTGLSVTVVGHHSVVGKERDAWLTVYSFTESDGTPRTGADTLDPGDAVRQGETLRIRYTPGPDGWSRVVGRYDGLVVWALAVSALVFWVSASLVARAFVQRLREQHCQEFDPCVRST